MRPKLVSVGNSAWSLIMYACLPQSFETCNVVIGISEVSLHPSENIGWPQTTNHTMIITQINTSKRRTPLGVTGLARPSNGTTTGCGSLIRPRAGTAVASFCVVSWGLCHANYNTSHEGMVTVYRLYVNNCANPWSTFLNSLNFWQHNNPQQLRRYQKGVAVQGGFGGVEISHSGFSWPGKLTCDLVGFRPRKPLVWYFHSKNTRVRFSYCHWLGMVGKMSR
jgi:hypothetical protein